LRKKLPKIIELKINPENIKVITGKWGNLFFIYLNLEGFGR